MKRARAEALKPIEVKVSEIENKSKFIKFCRDHISLSRRQLSRSIQKGCFKLNGETIYDDCTILSTGDIIEASFKDNVGRESSESGELEILFEDENVLILYKNSGVSCSL